MDKLLHFIAGAVIALVVIVGLISIGAALGFVLSTTIVLVLGVLAGGAIGIIKEILDSKGLGTPELMDAVATVAGSVLVAIIFSFIL